jgi:hypothetical protein
MTSTKPGWYANPDGSLNQRHWDGENWTDATRSYPPPMPMSSPAAVTSRSSMAVELATPAEKAVSNVRGLPRRVLFTIAGVAALALVLAIGIPTFSGSQTGAPQSAAVPTSTARPTTPVVKPMAPKVVAPAVPKVTPTPVGPVLVPLGPPSSAQTTLS